MIFFRWFYTALLYIILPFAFLKLYWRGRINPAYRQHWGERLGFVKCPDADKKKIIWVHAVSVGETIAIRPLIEALIAHYPTHKIWITNGTINGRARTESFFGDRVFNSYAPYDSPLMTRRFLKRVRPVLTLIMETEIWPNWIDALHEKSIPLILVNARLSEKSYLNYHRLRFFFHLTWQGIALVAAQAQADAERYQRLGVLSRELVVAGNLKYNLIFPDNLPDQISEWQQYLPADKIWITASTHGGEEEQLLQTFSTLKKQYPKLLWIPVPRHIENTETIKKMCMAEGWSVLLRSTLRSSPSHPITQDILLVDSIGELLLFYSLAQVAFVGGSLIVHGGHNILEAAAVGTVITCGPSMFNFSTILEQFKNACALVQCQNIEELTMATLALFADQKLCEAYKKAAINCFGEHQNVLSTYLSLISPFLCD